MTTKRKPKVAPKPEVCRDKTILIDNKRIAYVAVMDDGGKYRLGICKEGEEGYHAVKEDSDLGGEFLCKADADAVAADLNKRLGLDAREASAIVLSTLGGGR